MILKSLTYILSFIMGENKANGFVVLGLISMAFVFAYPISLIRVIVSFLLTLFVKKSSDRLIGFVLFFMFFNTETLKSAAILYPLMFLVFGTFRIKHIKRSSTLVLVQVALFHTASVGLILLYPILRKWMSGLIILIWLGYIFQFINPIIFFGYSFYQWTSTQLQTFYIIRGSLTMSVIALILVVISIYYFTRLKSGLLFGLSMCLIPVLSAPWFYQVTFISVGQGDAILLQTPFNKEVILIDTGKENAYGQLSSYINAQGITKLDALVITHDDGDHRGNIENLAHDYEIMRSVNQPEDINLHWFALKSLKTRINEPTDNQASLMFLFQINQLKFLLMADTDELTEIDLIQQYPDIKADILKVGHHGSATSTSDLLLSHIQARMAAISVGYNSYGHPSYLTLNRLKAFHVPIFTTKKQGDITFIMTPSFNILWTSSMKHRVLRLGV
ncbi:MAG: putative hydrolase (metallo-beta-lactamase superfamily) [Erysipelotrichaceae bacterium]|nr:MAG: putative hydrolase (metallo-beta-lactamase superfamily) [Erysipelotrichaceae bacterium]